MQETRRQILEIIKDRGQVSAQELARELGVTLITIRHHLDRLIRDGLVSPPQVIRKSGPGRPQHVYRLAEKAEHYLVTDRDLLRALLAELRHSIGPNELDKIINGVAQRIKGQLPLDECDQFKALVLSLSKGNENT